MVNIFGMKKFGNSNHYIFGLEIPTGKEHVEESDSTVRNVLNLDKPNIPDLLGDEIFNFI